MLLLSDLHLGRGSRDDTRAAERDAVALLRAHEAEIVDGDGTLVLLGDVYDQFIEYKHLVPKAAPRLVGLLAEWADAGARIVYVVGNRDPWHLDYFEADIGVTVVRGAWRSRLDKRALYIAHGDGQGRPISLAERLSHRLQPLLRAPLMARLYRMGLPGDTGYALARAVARRFGTDGAPDVPTAQALADAAQRRLSAGADVVAFGHSHAHALDASSDGLYLNPGYWFGARTFATLDAATARIARWRDGGAETLATEPLAPRPLAPRPLAPALS
ncbi:UDP-2,3-diacylglucosamine diphosphatase [Rubrivirga sp. IMCC43871]|uniref:UDP-2,3-diacylglucosamine diphosphatase n=1 Tax=Rubrivirga sp. IMCC43871 TaxID=3391575 RepID=UPI00398FA6F7